MVSEDEPPPIGYYYVPTAPTDTVQVAACTELLSDNKDDPVAVLIQIANGSQTTWTLDSTQVSIADSEGKWLPIPPEEAARMAHVSGTEKKALMVSRMGDFAAYGAGLGAAFGGIAAQIGPAPVDNGFELGAASGALLLGGLGLLYENERLDNAFETKEAGDANEKLKILALKDKTSLYSNEAVSGYVYFPSKQARGSNGIFTIPLIRGDSSKDWASPPQYNNSEYKVSPLTPERRPKVVDLAPVICECPVALDLCPDKYERELSKSAQQQFDRKAKDPQCTPAAGRTDHGLSCSTIMIKRVQENRPDKTARNNPLSQ